MKFSFSVLSGSKVRIGKITEFSRLPDTEFDTPNTFLYTRGGSLPHISHEVLQYLTQEKTGNQVTLPTTIQCYDSVKGFSKGISDFVGLKESLTYCSLQDSASKTPVGFHTKNEISIWSYNGRYPLDVNKYMDVMETFQPDIYDTLYNGDTNSETSKKKLLKVISSSERLLNACLERHNNSKVLRQSAIFGVVEGGYDLDLRKECAEKLAQKPVSGFVISGLHNNGPEVETMEFKNVEPLLKAVLERLPEDKPRMIHGCWNPDVVLKIVNLGIDIFDSSLAYIVTERHSAFIFQYTEIKCEDNQHTDPRKLETYEICLKNDIYKEDFSPLLEGCSCLTCRKYKRAYIHHLIKNKELLAHTLLMLHNFHHYMEFFKAIRRAGASGNVLSLK